MTGPSASTGPARPRIALVSGASRGIGRAIALELATGGCRVGIGYKSNAEAAAETIRLIQEHNPGRPEKSAPIAVQLDVADPESCRQAAEKVQAHFGALDILVNNAAITSDGPALGLEDEEWRKVMATVLDGQFFLARACARGMIRQRWGRIINISSVVARLGGRGQANYVAAKAGLEGLTRALAIELAPRGVLVNAVAAGAVETDLSRATLQEHGERALARILLGRLGTPGEIASMVGFLASDQASYITGQIFAVDGGYGLQV